MTLEVPPIATDDFKAETSFDGQQVSLKLVGNADIRAMFPLESLLKRLESEVDRVRVREVVVDLRNLEFMNSSCFKSFVSWLSDLQELPAEEVYMVRLKSDPEKHWQKRSLSALSCFAVDLVRLE